MNYSITCVDAGSENCPCYLALTGDCITCSRLRNKDYCDCNWSGVCVYNEFIQGGKTVNNPRKNIRAAIVEQKFYDGDIVLYVLDVGKGFAMRASRPGTYVFLKGQESAEFYEVPISVMKSDIEKGHIYLAIKVIAAKTKALLQQTDSLVIRGPYRGGIQGINDVLRGLRPDSKILILSKGIGLAPASLSARYLCQRCSVDLMMDPEKISKELIGDYIDDRLEPPLNRINEISLSDPMSWNGLEEQLSKNQYTGVLILTSDYYIHKIGEMVRRLLPGAAIGVCNNFHICCGEGLCGACTVETIEGDVLKMCKCQKSVSL